MSSAVTENVLVQVESFYLADQSDPMTDRYVFAYQIQIANDGAQVVQLISRHWFIEEADGATREVEGEGVVGEQPVMEPGESHEYTSGVILAGPSGKMRGTYQMRRDDGSYFDAVIPEFDLIMPRTLH